jgi:hypothetical protein
MAEESYALHCWWGSRREEAAACAEHLVQTLNGLAEEDHTFHNWDCCDLPAGLEEITALFNANRPFHSPPSREPWPELGFGLKIKNRLNDSDGALISLRVGAFGDANPHANSLALVFSKRRSSTRRPWTASDLRKIMRLIIKEWRPEEASVDCFRYMKFLRHYLNSNGQEGLYLPWEGWITYIPGLQVSRIDPPHGVDVERLDDGSALYSLCEEPFTIDNPKHMALAASMQKALEPIQTR